MIIKDFISLHPKEKYYFINVFISNKTFINLVNIFIELSKFKKIGHVRKGGRDNLLHCNKVVGSFYKN